MSPRSVFRPIDPAALTELLADQLASMPGLIRVAVDGDPTAEPDRLADSLVDPLARRGRHAVRIRSDFFWRDASLRLEYGHHDLESFAGGWLDAAALRREVLDALVESGDYLPSLRHPRTNRATRELRRAAPPAAVVLLSGELLLGRGLPFDRTVHLATGAAARLRRTPADQAWTLPAFDEYDRVVDPVATADVVVRVGDPRHPAISHPAISDRLPAISDRAAGVSSVPGRRADHRPATG